MPEDKDAIPNLTPLENNRKLYIIYIMRRYKAQKKRVPEVFSGTPIKNFRVFSCLFVVKKLYLFFFFELCENFVGDFHIREDFLCVIVIFEDIDELGNLPGDIYV